ncbi:MAG: hypothetical protein GY953_59145, partial [bacterium]|nr:hypothetical protein [bacterium]
MSAEVQELIDQIRSDNTSGATTLTRLAAKALSRSSALDETARALVAAQPAMAPILNLVNTVLSDARGAAACDEFLESLAANSEAAIRHGASLIQRSQTVLTHSFSSAVLDTLLAARCEVICTESRPICEGLDLARELAAAGIHVTLIVDAAMLAGLHRADLVLVGADSISAHGVTNKTGTAPLAELAASLSVPFYVICTSEKFLPAG